MTIDTVDFIFRLNAKATKMQRCKFVHAQTTALKTRVDVKNGWCFGSRFFYFEGNEHESMPKRMFLRHLTFELFDYPWRTCQKCLLLILSIFGHLSQSLERKSALLRNSGLCAFVFTSYSFAKREKKIWLTLWNGVTIFCYDDWLRVMQLHCVGMTERIPSCTFIIL